MALESSMSPMGQTPQVLAEPGMQKQLFEMGGDALIGTPEAFGAMIVAETEKWNRRGRPAGVNRRAIRQLRLSNVNGLSIDL